MSQITSIAEGARKFVVDNSPMILTGMAVAGVVTVAVLAAKASPRAVQDIQHAESERIDPLTNVEKVKLTYHYFIPAAVAGSLTIGAIVMAQSVNLRRQAAYISAYTIADNRYRDYQQKVAERVGDAKERLIQDDVAQDIVNRNPVSNRDVIITGNGNVLSYDPTSDRYFTADYPTLQKAEIDTNFQLLDEGYASLNDFYARCGLPRITLGEDVGWTADKKLELRITTTLSEENVPCLTISFYQDPFPKYDRFG